MLLVRPPRHCLQVALVVLPPHSPLHSLARPRTPDAHWYLSFLHSQVCLEILSDLLHPVDKIKRQFLLLPVKYKTK